MHGFALMILGIALYPDPVERPKDVFEIQTRQFALPVEFKEGIKDKIECVRLFVSEDRGKSWKHEKDYKPTVEKVTFTSPDDGLYWFAVQVVYKDGKKAPREPDDLSPTMKVYVNTERRSIKMRKSYGELLGEVEELQKKVEQLQKKIQQLEADRKPKQDKPEHK